MLFLISILIPILVLTLVIAISPIEIRYFFSSPLGSESSSEVHSASRMRVRLQISPEFVLTRPPDFLSLDLVLSHGSTPSSFT